ncbi:MAG: redox-regulated ATPase YchF [Dehalococcoidia bacterium]|nr:MAG: redox-regulated ATPase YchF [Dehalococcoidia bacterium]
MTVDIGIIGLPKSSKTTIFNGLVRGKADTGGYTKGLAPHIGIAKVPEPRLKVLADILKPKRVVPAEVRYIDIGASVKELVKDEAISGQLLNQICNADALINVVRAFADDSIAHPSGSLDVGRDIAAMGLELTFSDLTIIERRLKRIETSLKGAKPPERPGFLQEQELLMKIKAELEKDVPIRQLKLTADEAKIIANYQFLTAKPLLIVVNIGEEQLPQAASLADELNASYSQPHCRLITLCGKLEMELGQLDNSAAEEFQAEFGIQELGLERVIKLSYELLGLISFATTVSDEVRAWSIKNGTTALKAAGKIHSDMERGFIRAEVISYDDLVKCGSLTEARQKGLIRLEGKSYIVQDGDIITFLFNI